MVQRSDSLTAEDFVVFRVVFDEGIFNMLNELFTAMDTQNDGFITANSFQTGQFSATLAASWGEWEAIRLMFDADGDNHITPVEFVMGFARLALNQPIQIAYGTMMSLEEFYAHMQTLVHNFVADRVQACYEEVKGVLARRTVLKRSNSSLPLPSNEVYTARLNEAVLRKMSNVFRSIDTSHTGVITADDFQLKGKTLGEWDQVRSWFDADGNNEVSEKEFFHGFKLFLLRERLPVPAEGTMLTFMQHMHDLANHRLMAALATFEAQV